jgi:general secretion pathway protein G
MSNVTTGFRCGPRASRGALPARAARGFSLIEILVVMALIGIVIALVANRIGDGAVRGKVNATKIAIDSISGKIETYALDNGGPPQRLEDLLTKSSDATNWNGPYAKEKELKDPWNHPFLYRMPGDKGGDYDIYSYGPDGKEGGEGLKAADIGNW